MKIQKKKGSPEIFTGSMADITFLLIIYFMLTSVFSATRGLDFQLPKEDKTQSEIKKEDAIDIYVTADGAIEVDQQQMPLDSILGYIKTKLEQDKEKPVILRTSPDAEYRWMVQVFDTLRHAPEEERFSDGTPMEIKTISIPTQREIQNVWSLLGVE